MRLRPLVPLLLVAGLSGLPAPAPDAAASCVGPSLDLGPGPWRTGQPRTVTGEAFVVGCDDAFSCPGLGCGDCESLDPATPMTEVRLLLRQQGRTVPLGTADADETGLVTWRVELPGSVRPGRARLVAGDAEPVPIRVS